MREFQILAALILTAGAATASPPMELRVLPSGHVRLGEGPELDLPQFRDELKRLSAQHARPELDLHIDKGTNFTALAKVLTEMQKDGFRIAFMVGNKSN